MSVQAQGDYVRIFDTTLRDGEQAPGFGMTIEEKVRLGRQLERLGVDVIEAGFPAASDGDFEAVRKVAAEIRSPIVCGVRNRPKPSGASPSASTAGGLRTGSTLSSRTSKVRSRPSAAALPTTGSSVWCS